MTCVLLYSIVVKGRETSTANLDEARRKAGKLRNIHGKYGVWLRPHFAIVGGGR